LNSPPNHPGPTGTGTPGTPGGPRLSALVVNYDSGPFALACTRSLARGWAEAGFAPEDLEVVVVDNASPSAQDLWLHTLAKEGAVIVQSGANLGYSGGINLALEASTGGDDDLLALLNPDLYFLPGSVEALVSYLEGHPMCGAVGPHCFIDEERTLALPPPVFPGVRGDLSGVHGRLVRSERRRRTQAALDWWSADVPHEVEMLSGACLFMPRSVVADLGQLMDPRYPLFYEDADLSLRLRARGLELVHHPLAPVLHHWARSAGAGRGLSSETETRMMASQRAFFAHHVGGLSKRVARLARRIAGRRETLEDLPAVVDLGEAEYPVGLELPRAGPWLVELSMEPHWPAISGTFVDAGRAWTIPLGAWTWLFDGTYELRAVDVDTLEVAARWRFCKTTGPRTLPIGFVADVGGASAVA